MFVLNSPNQTEKSTMKNRVIAKGKDFTVLNLNKLV